MLFSNPMFLTWLRPNEREREKNYVNLPILDLMASDYVTSSAVSDSYGNEFQAMT